MARSTASSQATSSNAPSGSTPGRPAPPRPARFDPKAPTNVLILGGGGREHSLGVALKRSPLVKQVYFAPGNGGTAAIGTNVDLPIEPVNTKVVDDLDYFAREQEIGLIVVGPEDPLCAGMVDRLTEKGLRVFGPTATAARLEGDKAYAKDLMRACRVPTADAKIFTNYEAALAYADARETPVVVKAAGLAKGKGVVVCQDATDAVAAVHEIMRDQIHGDAGRTLLIEERLVGQELSVLALVDGHNIYMLDPTQDHKQAYEGDRGPNTGGMGAYCPTPIATPEAMRQIELEVFVPIVDAMRREGTVFKGVLYAGLMLTAGGVKVLEFNTRFGDPECQALVARLKGDLYIAMQATIDGKLDEADLSFDRQSACCVVVCSGGYPGKYTKNQPITGLREAGEVPGVQIFHAGTKRGRDGQMLTNGGRVINVVALGADLAEAQARANEAAALVEFEGAHFRRDIGHRVMSLPAGK